MLRSDPGYVSRKLVTTAAKHGYKISCVVVGSKKGRDYIIDIYINGEIRIKLKMVSYSSAFKVYFFRNGRQTTSSGCESDTLGDKVLDYVRRC